MQRRHLLKELGATLRLVLSASARSQLRERDKRFEDFVEASSDWFWEMDEDLRFSFFSDRFTEVTGVPHDRWLGKTWQESGFPNMDEESWRRHLDDLRAHRPFRDFVHPRTKENGETIWLLINGKPVFDDRGNFTGYRGTGSDITEKVETGNRLADAHERFMAAIECVSDGFALFDADDRLVMCNSRFRQQNPDLAPKIVPGMTFEQMLRDNIAYNRILNALDDKEAFVRKRMEQHRNPSGPLVQQRRDGRWLELREERTPDGSTLLMNTDITVRKRAEERLRESEQRLQTIIDNVPAAIFLKDTSNRYQLINRQYQDWFGVDPEKVVGKDVFDLYPKERAERYAASDREILRNWKVTTDEVDIPDSSGETKTFNLVKFPILDAGLGVGFGGVMIDVTERRRTEEALHMAKEQAELANRAKTEFLANMSHELRTPLNAIIGFSEVIKHETLGPVGSAKYLDYADDINESGQHLLSLINDILDLSKVESGTDELHEENIEIPEIANTIVKLVMRLARAGNVELELDVSDDIAVLHADERKVKQILLNLLSNAIKFTPAGGKVVLKIWSRAESGYVFQVNDTGIGIAFEDIPKALAPFQQIDSGLNRMHDGTGLGLPLTKSLVEMHGSYLDLQSKVGVGTTVTVRFPAERIVARRAIAQTKAG
jgi:PAS domain S-box-containing protein